MELLERKGIRVNGESRGNGLSTVLASVDGKAGYICLEEVLGDYATEFVDTSNIRIVIASGDRGESQEDSREAGS